VLTGKLAPGLPNQAALRLLLSNGSSTQITVDDTAFPTSPSGTIFVVDTLGDTVYAVKSGAFQPGGVYSARSQNVDVAFKVERTGDLSKEIEVKYVVKEDLKSELHPILRRESYCLGLIPSNKNRYSASVR
jgi:hypothetical protein